MDFNTDKGALLIVKVEGIYETYIAEVIENEDNLVIKIAEKGSFSRLEIGEYRVLAEETVRAQKSITSWNELLEEAISRGEPYGSGLARFGIEPGEDVYEILPITVEKN